MTKRSTLFGATALFWLVAGTGLSFIVALICAIILVPARGHDLISVSSTPKPHHADLSPAIQKKLTTIAISVPSPTASISTSNSTVVGVKPAPRQPSGSAEGNRAIQQHATVVVRVEQHLSPQHDTLPAGAPTSITSPSQPVPAQTASAPARLQKSTDRAANPSEPKHETETVIVTSPPPQQMALDIDVIGRGNSLVIQLPRAKRQQK